MSTEAHGLLTLLGLILSLPMLALLTMVVLFLIEFFGDKK